MKKIRIGRRDTGKTGYVFIHHLLEHRGRKGKLVVYYYSAAGSKVRIQERFSHYVIKRKNYHLDVFLIQMQILANRMCV